jgi:hypothetical protein
MFEIDADPTFKERVTIAKAGGKTGEVIFEFRHKDSDELAEFLARAETVKPAEWAKEIVVGWEGVKTAFDEAALARMLKQNLSAAEAIMKGYLRGLSGGRLGN